MSSPIPVLHPFKHSAQPEPGPWPGKAPSSSPTASRSHSLTAHLPTKPTAGLGGCRPWAAPESRALQRAVAARAKQAPP